MTHNHDFTGSLMTSILTAALALIPEAALSYGAKLVSVFILAIAAELGRRLVNHIWKTK